ncbi:MAG: cyclopropane-fatty-acyl-phospholipid synthase [Alphaproteobacteria bacterium]|jgi:cyclopropane-fatty-acyl-phospholipid synthase|nr:cyclopropane-fatty-acyl-phospholipid synthase [Alphaproteobacteria bacterium]
MLGVVLTELVEHGTLTFIWPDGKQYVFGAGGPRATARLHGRWTPLTVGLKPELAFGEAYMDGRLTVEEGTIADVLEILISNMGTRELPANMRAWRLLRHLYRSISQFNPATRARKNVAHHYDLSAALYDLFLDADRQYSCAYFNEPRMTLEAAQAAKKRHIAAKLKLDTPGLSVLDIGSGWGGLGLELAREARANVLGVTLSSEQLALASQRAVSAGLSERCRFELKDYRDLDGPFDRIVSVGMFEHVGVRYYDTFFRKLHQLLAPGGVALLHTIGRTDGPGATNPWIAKYIFPGGYVPALSEVMAVIERSGLFVTDVEILRLHYAETLKEWRTRFLKNWAKAAALYDERFCRMWEFYLAAAEMTFRYDRQAVFQIQLSKRIETLPMTRDYMLDTEREMGFASAEQSPREHAAA